MSSSKGGVSTTATTCAGSEQSRQLEQFVVLAQSASTSEASLAKLVERVLKNRSVFVFGELLALECVQALKGGAHDAWFRLLEIFARGTMEKYYAPSESALPPLDETLERKLRMLTVASIAGKHKMIPYDDLLRELRVGADRELEDVVVSCMYAGLIKGKLNQQLRRVEVAWAMGRDVGPDDLDAMIAQLNTWCASADSLLEALECIENAAPENAEHNKSSCSAANANDGDHANKEVGPFTSIKHVNVALETMHAIEQKYLTGESDAAMQNHDDFRWERRENLFVRIL